MHNSKKVSVILEVAILTVIDGRQDQFEIDFYNAGKYISSIKGYINHSLSKCIEQEINIFY